MKEAILVLEAERDFLKKALITRPHEQDPQDLAFMIEKLWAIEYSIEYLKSKL